MSSLRSGDGATGEAARLEGQALRHRTGKLLASQLYTGPRNHVVLQRKHLKSITLSTSIETCRALFVLHEAILALVVGRIRDAGHLETELRHDLLLDGLPALQILLVDVQHEVVQRHTDVGEEGDRLTRDHLTASY